MNKLKKVFIFLLCLIMSFSCCNLVFANEFNTDSITLKKGESKIIYLIDYGGSTRTTDPMVATISLTGGSEKRQYVCVKARGGGTCYITNTGSTNKVKVTVIELVEKISVSIGNSSLTVGDSTTCSASVSPSSVTNKAISWSSSNSSIAKVNSSGKVTAVSKGSTTIVAKAKDGSGVTGSCTVTCKAKTNEGGVRKTTKAPAAVTTTRKASSNSGSSSGSNSSGNNKTSTTVKASNNSKGSNDTFKAVATQPTDAAAEPVASDVVDDSTSVLKTTEDEFADTTSDETTTEATTNPYQVNAPEVKMKHNKPVNLAWSETLDTTGYELYLADKDNDYVLIYQGPNAEYALGSYKRGHKYKYKIRGYKINQDKTLCYYPFSEEYEFKTSWLLF